MKKNPSELIETLLYKSSKLAHAINLLVVSLMVVFGFLIDDELVKSFLISVISIIVVFLYYIKINFEIFEQKILILNDLVCMIFWLVISAFWFSQFFARL